MIDENLPAANEKFHLMDLKAKKQSEQNKLHHAKGHEKLIHKMVAFLCSIFGLYSPVPNERQVSEYLTKPLFKKQFPLDFALLTIFRTIVT